MPTRLRKPRVVSGALLIVLLLASLDQTTVSTALPTIAGSRSAAASARIRLITPATLEPIGT
jgi:hypothetical protein